MSMNNSKYLSLLDRQRLSKGPEEFKAFLYKIARKNSQKAINLLNDESLHFTSLFILRSVFEEPNLFQSLNSRNKVALILINEILTRNKYSLIPEYLSLDYIQLVHSVLKWILETGAVDDGLNNQFDEVLDIAAILLIKVYRDKTILPLIVDMIFKRNRKGFFYHDLVWAFFESREPNSLVMIADGLKSNYSKDVQLSRKLLSFIPRVSISSNTDKEKQYIYFINWIKENSSFLRFTGEGFQLTNNPLPYVLVLEAKYICQNVSVDTGKPLKLLAESENRLLDEYNKLDDTTKILLANYSYMLHCKNIEQWNIWLTKPITEQINTVKARIGGL